MDPHVCPHRRGFYTLGCKYVLRRQEHGHMLSKWGVSAQAPEVCAYVHIGSALWTCTPLHCRDPEKHTHACTFTLTHTFIFRPWEACVHRHTQFHRCMLHRDTHVDPYGSMSAFIQTPKEGVHVNTNTHTHTHTHLKWPTQMLTDTGVTVCSVVPLQWHIKRHTLIFRLVGHVCIQTQFRIMSAVYVHSY